MTEIAKLTTREVVRVRELAGSDKKLSAAFQLAARLAKGDSNFRVKANRVARDFVMNRRALGKAIPAAGIGRGKKSFKLKDFGVSEMVSHYSQVLASIPEAELQTRLLDMETKDVIQLTPLYQYQRELKRRQRKDASQLSEDHIETRVADVASVPGEWRCIYADPPWSYGDAGVKGGGVAHQYKSMSVEQIGQLPVGELAHEEGAHLWLWTTWPMIRERVPHAVLDAWGFEWKGEIVWHKLSTRRQETFFGVGRWLRPATEVLVFAVKKGEKAKRPPPLIATGKELLGFCSHQVLGHSRKPERFRELIEQLSPGPRIELFARRAAAGWSRWGDQA